MPSLLGILKSGLTGLAVSLVIGKGIAAGGPQEQSCSAVLDAETALRMGMLYDTGFGVPQNFSLALDCYRRAAEAGLREGQFNLGAMYANGRGTPRDLVQAAFWYQRAAEQGDGRAAYVLGLMNENGEGMPLDPQKALKWYRVASDNGVVAAKSRIAKLQSQQGAAANSEKVFKDQAGRPCRLIQREVMIDGKRQPASARMCLEEDGRWVVRP